MTMPKLKHILIPNLLIFPTVCHWLLPSGLEMSLTIQQGLVFFLPALSYFIYIVLYPQLHIRTNGILSPKALLIVMTLFLVWEMIGFLINGCDLIINRIINNNAFVILLVIFSLYPLDKVHFRNTSYILMPTLLILVAQVVLYGMGILTYTTSEGDLLGSSDNVYGGILRISTTVGGSTGTAFVIAALGIIALCCYDYSNYRKVFVILLATIGVFFSVSRGSILLWLVFLIYFFYKHYLRHSSLKRNLVFFMLLSMGILTLYAIGVFEPLIQRNVALENDFDTGRDNLRKEALKIYESSGGMGVGLGQVFPDKSLQQIIKSPYRTAPHNVYLIFLSELGFVGIALLICTLIAIVRRLDFSKDTTVCVVLILLISSNTEGVIIYYEFMSVVIFLCMFSVRETPLRKCKQINSTNPQKKIDI